MTKAPPKSGAKKAPAKAVDSRKPKHSNDANRASQGVQGQRDAATVRRLNMYKSRPKRDKKGLILREEYQSKELPSTRIQPDRRWFGNTRVIGQKQLDQFRTEMSTKVNDAYTVLLREKKLPLQLLEDPEKKLAGKQVRSNLLTTQPFKDIFGPNQQRKRPKLTVDTVVDLVSHAGVQEEKFIVRPIVNPEALRNIVRDSMFDKGQSKRIWGELYKVLDSSDVIVEVLDARDPNGTRCFFLEQHIRKNLRHKHIILLLNKCDLVPAWVTKRWLHHLSREFPTLAFHASITNPFGKGALLSLLRQLSRLRSDKQAVSVGFVGYPNVGKSSVINTLRTKKVCKAAPIPGETKVWQYITLMKRIFCIDCPGVVYNKASDTETDAVLKGVVRVENLADATEHIPNVLARCKPEYLKRAYKISAWSDSEDFLTQMARLNGKLLPGGEPDINTAARMVLYDWQRGKIPFFTLPPGHTEEKPKPEISAAEALIPSGAATASGEAPSVIMSSELEEAVPIPAHAVTDEDAMNESGIPPQQAAATARALRSALANATNLQAKSSIPVMKDFFLPDDERREGDDDGVDATHDNADEDVVSEDSSEEGEEEDAEGDGAADGRKGSSAGPSSGAAGKRRRADGPAEEEDSGDESDGYGEGALVGGCCCCLC
ncbi:MAG: hypothetical protein WDW38_004918 [Sanguina aurantia]